VLPRRDCRQMRRMVRQIFNLHLKVLDWASPKGGRVDPCLQIVAGHARVVVWETDQFARPIYPAYSIYALRV